MKAISRKKPEIFWPKWLRPSAKIFGGKYYVCRKMWAAVYAHLKDEYGTIVDLYGGLGTMAANAPSGHPVIYVEKNLQRFNLMRVIRDDGPALIELLREIKYTEETFEKFKAIHELHKNPKITGVTPMERAISYLTCHRMSRGGMGKTFAWSDRLRGGQPGDLNAWETNLKNLQLLHDRYQGWEMFNEPAMVVYNRLKPAADNTLPKLWYIDPPYPNFTRTTKALEYGDDEMTIEQHTEMLRTVVDSEEYVAISSYRNDLYDALLPKWKRLQFDMANHSGQTKEKERRIESVYINF